MRLAYKVIAPVSVVVLLWYILSMIPKYALVIPPPHGVFAEFLDPTTVTTILGSLWLTLVVAGKCVFYGCLIGYILGLTLGRYDKAHAVLYPVLNGLRSVPVTAFIPAFLMIFGLFRFLVPLVTVPILSMCAVNIAEASKTCNRNREAVIALHNVNAFSYARHVVFWETLEVLFSTLRIALPFAFALVIAIEYFVGVNEGLGHYISSHYDSGRHDQYKHMYAGIVVASVFGISVVGFVDWLARRSLKWRVET